MKLKYKKLLLASVAISLVTPFSGGGAGIAHAASVTVQPSNPSDNTVEVNENDYTINGKSTTIANDDVYSYVYGGYYENGNSTGNIVNINGGIFTFSNYVYGGYSIKGDVTKNTVTINGGNFSNYSWFSGGYSRDGNATDNTVNINGGTFHSVLGGNSFYGEATGNTVNIKDGTFTDAVVGGDSRNGNAIGNTVNIQDGTFNLYVFGGDALHINATNNTVNIDSGTFSNWIFGGEAGYGDATYNTVNIKGGTFTSWVAGGRSTGGDATGNTVKISGTPDLSSANLYGGKVVNGTSSGNLLEIHTTGLTAQNISDFQIIKFYLPSNVDTTTPVLSLSATSTDISGAVVKAGVEGNANLKNGDVVTLLTNNGTITDTGTTYGKLTEGVSLTYDLTVSKSGDNKIIATIGSTSSDTSTTDTTTTDTSTTDTSTSDTETTDTTTPTSNDDSGNTKNIYSNADGETIYGGYTTSGNAKNNIVNLYGGTYSGSIYGGYAPSGSTSGNVLNVYNKNISAQNLYNFDSLNFYIPNDASSGDTMLTLTDSAATDLSGVAIRAGVLSGNSSLAVGDSINLLQNSSGFITDAATSYGRLTEGVSLDYGLDLTNSGNSIVATINSVPQKLNSVTEQIPLGGGVTALKTVDAILDNNNLPAIGLDFDFESDSDDASSDEISDIVVTDAKGGWEIFASMGGGALKTKAGDGAYVDMKISSFDVGFARTLDNGGAGKFAFAPIIDYAHGNYDSYLADGTHGTGSTRYIAGGGVFRNMWDSGFYVEGSFRAGKVKNEFASNDMDKAYGQRVSYDTDATAMAGHLKLGKNLRLNKNNLLDVYATYYHAHQGGMNADLAPYGDKYRISSADSGRFRIGYRLTTRTSKISRIYTGLAYQYEHADGITANYLSKNLSTESAGDSGSSGMLEIGWQIKPLKNNPWTVDINATGWAGHQRGVTAMAKIQKSF